MRLQVCATVRRRTCFSSFRVQGFMHALAGVRNDASADLLMQRCFPLNMKGINRV